MIDFFIVLYKTTASALVYFLYMRIEIGIALWTILFFYLTYHYLLLNSSTYFFVFAESLLSLIYAHYLLSN